MNNLDKKLIMKQNKLPKENWVEEGKKLEQLIISKGYSLYKFAMLTHFSDSRLYVLVKGQADITTMSYQNALIFARVLGFANTDDLFDSLGIDTLKDLVENGGR